MDDHPENNAYEVEVLQLAGANVQQVETTEDALQLVNKPNWDLIISDMGRGTNPRAGLEFLERMRAEGNQHEVLFYCSERGWREFGPRATELGGTFVSPRQKLFAATRSRIGVPPDPPAR